MDGFKHFLDIALQWIAGHGDNIPFMAAGTRVSPKVTKVRIVEALIIAGGISALGYFFMVPRIIDVIENEMSHMRKDIGEIKVDINEARQERRDLQRQIDQAISNGQWRSRK